MTAVKLANAATPDTHDYCEAETREHFIDLLLKDADRLYESPFLHICTQGPEGLFPVATIERVFAGREQSAGGGMVNAAGARAVPAQSGGEIQTNRWRT